LSKTTANDFNNLKIIAMLQSTINATKNQIKVSETTNILAITTPIGSKKIYGKAAPNRDCYSLIEKHLSSNNKCNYTNKYRSKY
jgi:hypothetical protein